MTSWTALSGPHQTCRQKDSRLPSEAGSLLALLALRGNARRLFARALLPHVLKRRMLKRRRRRMSMLRRKDHETRRLYRWWQKRRRMWGQGMWVVG
jgi:hypothetical protein